MKIVLRRIFAVLYLSATLLAYLVIVKPDASLFYARHTIPPQAIVQDAGGAFRYELKVNPAIVRTQGILLYEAGKKLNLAAPDIVASYSSSTYAITAPSRSSVFIYFSASSNGSPITNGKAYTLLMPLRFVTKTTGTAALATLLPLIIWFMVFAMTKVEHRQAIRLSPGGILRVFDQFGEHISQRSHRYFHWLWQQVKTRAQYWRCLFAVTVLAAFLYIFMEWVFFVTMPSFMSLMNLTDKVVIYLLSGWGFALACLLILAGFILLDLLSLVARLSRITRFWGIAIPSVILTALALMLLDNFTYTVFKFGITTSTGVVRGVYALVFLAMLGLIYYRMLGIFGLVDAEHFKRHANNRWFYISLGFIVITTGLVLAKLNYSDLLAGYPNAPTQKASNFPNILLLGSDGLNADNLSAYGYVRDTTPRLKELAQTSLVVENAFTNAGNSAGSVISIMTSKLPTQTRVLYPPDILTGLNSYQHLPGILNNLGYAAVEFGVPYYVDAYTYNLQSGFDVVNNRTVSVGRLGDLGRKLGFENEVYLLSRLIWRISERILHIFYIQEMQNPFAIVTQPVPSFTDQSKIDRVVSLFDQTKKPLFAHVHLLGTHGGYYIPELRVYSQGENQSQPWMTDFYDDTLLGFDALVGQVVDHLKANGQFDNTILIIYTDHNKEFKVNERIPLIIHFPRGEHAGQISYNAENIDIAPTILDYLGVSKPTWMEGESLLGGNATGQRLIFGTGTTKVKPNEQDVSFIDPALNKAPFYQFSYLNVIDCQKWYAFDLTTYQWTGGDVTGYVKPCSEQELLSEGQIKDSVYQRLAQDGFDIASLP